MTDNLNSNVHGCFDTFDDKYLKLRHFKNFHALCFFMVHLVRTTNQLHSSKEDD